MVMALIDCYECGKRISDTAASCPSCGAPAKKKTPDRIDASFQIPLTPSRVVSFPLFLAVIFAPFIFFWFLLRHGYSSKVRALGLCWLVIFVYLYFASNNSPNGPESQIAAASPPKSKLQLLDEKYPESSALYEEVNSAVGCGSKFSDQKKKDIFDRDYKNHWMTWRGVVALADADDVSLNLDGVGIQDLQVDFLSKGAGYDLKKGDKIQVRFLMSTAGGCFLPFSGDYAVIDGKRSAGIEQAAVQDIKSQAGMLDDVDAKSGALRWSIQVASLSDQSTAESLVSTLKRSGYVAYLTRIDNVSRVFIGPLTERAEADRLREQLKQSFHLNGFVVRYLPRQI